ncbi:MAG: Lrp/AsnC ligand binding domain-containing protein [Actinomycetota bacterium]
MTVSAYVLIQTEMDKAAAVAHAISEIDGVVAVDVVTGPYDVIAKTSADTMDELGRMVVSSVQKVPGINRTLTSPVVNL